MAACSLVPEETGRDAKFLLWRRGKALHVLPGGVTRYRPRPITWEVDPEVPRRPRLSEIEDCDGWGQEGMLTHLYVAVQVWSDGRHHTRFVHQWKVKVGVSIGIRKDEFAVCLELPTGYWRNKAHL